MAARYHAKLLREIQAVKKELISQRLHKHGLPEYPEKFEDFAGLLEIRSGLKFTRFVPFDYQIRLIDAIAKYSSVTIIKSRQLGITLTLLAYLLKRQVENKAFYGAFFTKGQFETGKAAERLRGLVESLELQTLTDNVQNIHLLGGGQAVFMNSSPEKARSADSVALNIFDEAAFIENIDRIYVSASPSQILLQDEAKEVVISTPDGVGGWYYDRVATNNSEDIFEVIQKVRAGKLPPYYEVEENNGKGVKIIIHWKAHPIYSQIPNYLDQVQEKFKLTRSQVLQEYDLDFTQSGTQPLQPYVQRCKCDRMPTRFDAIYIGVDVAGPGSDFFVARVNGLFDQTFYTLDYYADDRASKEFHLSKVSALIDRYNPDLVLVEKNYSGYAIAEDLVQLRPGTRIETFATTSTSRPVLITRLELTMERARLKYFSDDPFITEATKFRYIDGKPQAPIGVHDHDDHVISQALTITAAVIDLGDDILKVGLVEPDSTNLFLD